MTAQNDLDPLAIAIRHWLAHRDSPPSALESECVADDALTQLVLGELSPARVAEINQHLALCVYCRAVHFSLKTYFLDEPLPGVPEMHQEDPRMTELLREDGYSPDGMSEEQADF